MSYAVLPHIPNTHSYQQVKFVVHMIKSIDHCAAAVPVWYSCMRIESADLNPTSNIKVIKTEIEYD